MQVSDSDVGPKFEHFMHDLLISVKSSSQSFSNTQTFPPSTSPATPSSSSCPTGRWGATLGAMSLDGCEICRGGTYSNTTGATTPQCSGLCPPGKYSDDGYVKEAMFEPFLSICIFGCGHSTRTPISHDDSRSSFSGTNNAETAVRISINPRRIVHSARPVKRRRRLS